MDHKAEQLDKPLLTHKKTSQRNLLQLTCPILFLYEVSSFRQLGVGDEKHECYISLRHAEVVLCPRVVKQDFNGKERLNIIGEAELLVCVCVCVCVCVYVQVCVYACVCMRPYHFVVLQSCHFQTFCSKTLFVLFCVLVQLLKISTMAG